MRPGFRLACLSSMVAAVVVASLGCSSSDDAGPSANPWLADKYPNRWHLTGPLHEGGACNSTVVTPPWLKPVHVVTGTPIDYTSNPPDNGPHYAEWAKYRYYDVPVDPRYWVHDLEHGAIVLLYRCADRASCPELAVSLEAFADSTPTDARCLYSEHVQRRVIVAPDPDLPTTIGAAAWGWTYTADCVDTGLLKDFVFQHYGQGDEPNCADGVDPS